MKSRYQIMFVLAMLFIAGCFEGPTGPAGPQGEQGIQGQQGEKGDNGAPGDSSSFVEMWDHTITAYEAEIIGTSAVITIGDARFGMGYDYKFWKVTEEGDGMVNVDMVMISGVPLYFFGISDGSCIFTAFASDIGTTLRIFKYKPTMPVLQRAGY